VAVWNQSRIEPKRWQLDWQGIRNGDYSDRYFWNGVRILQQLAQEGYRFAGHSPRLAQQGLAPQPPEPIGDIRVEMQFFARRKPFTVVAGIDTALAILQHATGYFAGERFVNTAHLLEVEAVHDGFIAPYEGDPMQIVPVLKVRGRYRDFALLETPLLGVLTRMSRIATNTYCVLQAARGKPVLFFPARFDLPQTQMYDGYAYYVGVQRYNLDHHAHPRHRLNACPDAPVGRYSRRHNGARANRCLSGRYRRANAAVRPNHSTRSASRRFGGLRQ
jgi:nicotinate phosphoribosyltransferase